jgi:hypothetical protein
LHEALQVAFGWAGTHTYDFKIKDPNAEPAPELDAMAFIQRRMMENTAKINGGAVPDSGPRQNFLRIIEDEKVGGGFFGGIGIDRMHNIDRVHSQTPERKSDKIRLSKVFEDKEYKGAGIEYEYDFGDCWVHEIEIIGRADATRGFECLDGEGHGVAEDAGSVEGWLKLRDAYRAQRPTKDQKETMAWFERNASNCDMKGLGNGRDRFWDMGTINSRLYHLDC